MATSPEQRSQTIKCKCGHEITHPLAWFRDHPKFKCPKCGVPHSVEGAAGLIDAHAKVEKLKDDLREKMRRMSGRKFPG